MWEGKPVRAAKTKALEAIRTISTKSKRPMKTTQANTKPKIIKKLSANESELSAGKINTKSAVKKVLKNISNNTNVLTKPNSKVTSNAVKKNLIKVNNQSSVASVKSSKATRVLPLKPIAFKSFKETLSFMTASTTSLSSNSFVPAEKSTPLHDRTANTSTNTNQPSELLCFTTVESSSCAKVDTLDSPPVIESNGKKNPYSFGMIETDDSTDGEDDVEIKPDKRPPPPAWSLPVKRTITISRQLKVPINLVDTFFGRPPEVDLLEIFPEINMKLLTRRDSSFVWRTPPRYSVLPKY